MSASETGGLMENFRSIFLKRRELDEVILTRVGRFISAFGLLEEAEAFSAWPCPVASSTDV